MEGTGMEHIDGLSKTTKVYLHIGTDENCSEAKRCCTNSYAYFIEMMLYMASNTKQDVSSVVHKCSHFIHNTMESP